MSWRTATGTAVFTALLAFGAARPAHAEEPEAALAIAEYRGDARCAVSFTFDDGSRDQLDLAVPILDEFGMKATFYVNPGLIDDEPPATVETNAAGARKGLMSWAELRQLAARGHEIGNHGLTHLALTKIADPTDLRREIDGGIQIMATKLGRTPPTYAYAYLAVNDAVRGLVTRHHVGDRVGVKGYGGPTFTVEQANGLIDVAKQKRSWLVPMLHNVGTEGWLPILPDVLRGHLASIREQGREVWVDTFAAVNAYARERAAATVSIIPSPLTAEEKRAGIPEREEAAAFVNTNGMHVLTFLLETSLDTTVYCEPLTVIIPTPGVTAVRVEAEWLGCSGSKPRVTALPGKILVDVAAGPLPVQVRWK